MGKRLLSEARFDWRGGLNTAVNRDQLSINELAEAKNVRLEVDYGAISKRTGTRRLHGTALATGASIRGLTQWDSPNGKQLVAIAGGNLYHRLQSSGQFSAFTEVVPSAGDEFSTSEPAFFVPFRSTSANAALLLFIASGGKLYKWDGSSLTRIDGTNNAPGADRLASYHTRLFARDSTLVKHLQWSYVGDGEDWTVDANDVSSGGQAVVDLLTGEEIVTLGVVGSSLCIATEDSLVRFTGYSSEDIRIAQDTEGISAAHGAVGPRALGSAEEFLAMLSAEGPYLVEEAGVRAIGTKVEPEFDGLDRTGLANAAVAYHRGRRELWYAVEASGDTGNQTIYAFSMRTQSWQGPWEYPFAINSLARYEDPSGVEYLVAACDDGFVRHMDTGAKDDVLSDGTGGSTYELRAELAPVLWETGPAQLKSLYRAMVNVDAASSVTLDLETSFDGAAFSADSFSGDSEGTTVTRRVDLNGQGNRLRVRISDNSAAAIPIVRGLQLYAYDMRRLTS